MDVTRSMGMKNVLSSRCIIKRACRNKCLDDSDNGDNCNVLIVLLTVIVLVEIELMSCNGLVSNDDDLYGVKVGMNDVVMMSVDNLNGVLYASPVVANNIAYETISFNESTCNFAYSIVVPIWNNVSFVYNCIDNEENNISDYFVGNENFSFSLINEQKILNYSREENFAINIDGDNTGVYGFADGFLLYYEG